LTWGKSLENDIQTSRVLSGINEGLDGT